MKSMTTMLLVVFAFVLNVKSQCYLESPTCGILKATLENVPSQILALPKKVSTEKKHKPEPYQLTFLLEQEITSGIWKKLKQVKTNEPVALFENVGNGTYRVTSIANNAVEKTKTKVHQHVKGFNAKFDGFSSNTITMTSCEGFKPVGKRTVAGKISVYPNPTKDVIHITGIPSGNSTGQAQLYDLNGRALMEIAFDPSLLICLSQRYKKVSIF